MPYIKQEDRSKVLNIGIANTPGELNYLLSHMVHNFVLRKGLSYATIVDVEVSIHRVVEKCLGLKHTKKDNELVLQLFSVLKRHEHIDEEVRLVTLGLVGAEFYRTVAGPYEDKKRLENGSVSELDKVEK